MDFQDIKGQEHAKRGLEVALTGNHGVLLVHTKDNADVRKLRQATYDLQDKAFVKPTVLTMLCCKCGYFTDPHYECHCSPRRIQNHLIRETKRLPLDNIDIHLEVPHLKSEHLSEKRCGENSAVIKERVDKNRGTLSKFRIIPITSIAGEPWELSKEAEELLKLAILELGISAQSYDKILRVSRTISVMDGSIIIEPHHISEAISYRSLDRNLWG